MFWRETGTNNIVRACHALYAVWKYTELQFLINIIILQ